MKKVIVALVVLVHVGLIYWLFFTESHRSSAPDPEAREAKPADPVMSAPVTPPPPLPAEETLDSLKLTYVNRVLPAALARQVNDCTSGVLIDANAKQILWRKNETQPVAIASMTKMMTALLLMEAIQKDKKLTLETRIQVTAAASKIGGSQVYLDPKETFTVDELLKCIMIKSANDAAYLISEVLGDGSPDKFVADMNRKAQELGLRSMKFYNAHGLPPAPGADENQGNAMELAFLGMRLLEYPEIVKWSAKRLDYIRENDPKKKFELVNHNKLVGTCPGVNGMKTGLTAKSRFCVTVTCSRSGRLLVCVVNGSPTIKSRNALAEALLNWGYSVAGQPAPAPVGTSAPKAPGAAAAVPAVTPKVAPPTKAAPRAR